MRLSLPKEIYEVSSIKAAAAAYAGLAEITVEDGGAHWICRLSNCRYGEELTALEFENYVIDHMNGS